ncbi:MAG: cytochrome c biogenesis protein CcsA [Phycisphaerales bacterium]|nr:cytochrome c biogenesis protein CcsA [Phycisphaerales bacterium]
MSITAAARIMAVFAAATASLLAPAGALAQDDAAPDPHAGLGSQSEGAAAAPQRGPAGNAHPTEMFNAAMSNPLAASPQRFKSDSSPAQKYDFARSVDLSPLAGLAVMHNSRVAILDTVARDTISEITGHSYYHDVVQSSGDSSPHKLKYAALFTYLDLMADQPYYLDKPIISVEYLPMRRGIVETAFPKDPGTQERWMKATRLSPNIIISQAELINGPFRADLTFARGMSQLLTSFNRFSDPHATLLLIAPASEDGDWMHVSRNAELNSKFVQLGNAWRARDAQKVNTLVRDIAVIVPAINAEHYPPAWRGQLERLYNGGNNFIFGYTFYFLALVALLIAFGTGRITLQRLGVGLLLAGLAIHLTGFVIRWVLAERIPIQNQFESMWGLSLGACLFATITMFVRRQPIFGVAAAGVGFLALMAATLKGIPGADIGREAAILNTSYILFYHVNIVLFSYGMIALGFIVSIVYLLVHYLAGRSAATVQLAAAGVGTVTVSAGDGGGPVNVGRQRLLSDLDHAQMVILQLAFWILGVGILLGAWWADHSWGRWWAFDPKETWALITWIVYLIVIHVRFAAPNRGLTTAWLSIVGFFIMLWTYFGVNLLLPGLHAYA